MNLSFAEARRAASVATSMLAPIVLTLSQPASTRTRPLRARTVPAAVARVNTKPSHAQEIPRAQEPQERAFEEQTPQEVELIEAAPKSEDPAVQEPEAAVLVCRPSGPTRELLDARKGITNKDIAGEREAELIRRYKAGDRNAGEVLLLAHSKLIGYFAKKYGGGAHDLEKDEVYAIAQVGFLEGVSRYEPERGFKLITYVEHWIRGIVRRDVLNTGTTIRVPINMRGWQAEGKKYNEQAKWALFPKRLDAPVGDDSEQTFADLTVDDAPLQDEQLRVEQETGVVERLLGAMSFSPIEHALVTRRLLADEPETLQEIGDAFGLSKERVRQIEERVVARLRQAYMEDVADEEDAEVSNRDYVPVVDAGACQRCGRDDHYTITCERWAGQRRGKLVCLRGTKKRNGTRLLVRCDCGTEKDVPAVNFGRGSILSCGCDRFAKIAPAPGCRRCGGLDHYTSNCERWAGLRFGRLLVVRGAGRLGGSQGGGFVLVKCDCGTEKVVRSGHLKSGKIESCGCLRTEWLATARAARAKKNT